MSKRKMPFFLMASFRCESISKLPWVCLYMWVIRVSLYWNESVQNLSKSIFLVPKSLPFLSTKNSAFKSRGGFSPWYRINGSCKTTRSGLHWALPSKIIQANYNKKTCRQHRCTLVELLSCHKKGGRGVAHPEWSQRVSKAREEYCMWCRIDWCCRTTQSWC